MGEVTKQRVAAASRAWTGVHPDAERVDTEDYLLLHNPAHFAFPCEVVRFSPSRDVAEVIGEVLEVATAAGHPTLRWAIRMGEPNLAPLLEKLGGVRNEAFEVMALDVADPSALGELSASGAVEHRWVTDVENLADFRTVAREVFGGEPETPQRLAAAAAHLPGAGVAPSMLVAYVGGRPVAASGLEVVDAGARLTGGSVLPAYRHRGIYRHLLSVRLHEAQTRGGEFAITRARVDTSAPILRGLGFTTYGHEATYLVPLR